jgi:DNA repair photolyase
MENSKQQLYYFGDTGIGEAKKFEKKLLASYSVNIGNICAFGCSYCYVPTVVAKIKVIRDILAQGYKTEDISCYRHQDNVLDCIFRDLDKIHRDDNGTVFFCTTCDPCAIPDHADTTTKAIRLIMERSNLQVRVLSKSILIIQVAQELQAYRDRIVYGLSTGTTLSVISQAVEERASDITERVRALHWLQNNGFRTFGMICPVIPSEVDNVMQLLEQVRPELCAGVWVEPLNIRGKSLVNTFNKLVAAGLEDHAVELQRVMGNKRALIEYSKRLFLGFQSEMQHRGLIDKMHYLHYRSKYDGGFFEGQPGAVIL